VNNVRNLRNQYETKVLDLLKSNDLRTSTLKITNATLQSATRFKPTDLSWTFLEEQLHEYYKTSGKRDETKEVLEFLQKHRGGKSVEYLKKSTITPNQTQPPPGTLPAK
jgi:hypothetical protein